MDTMVDNYIDIAAVNGRLRAGEDIHVLSSLHNDIASAVSNFARVRAKRVGSLDRRSRRGGGAFVLMPFKPSIRPIFEDHIAPVFKSLGIPATRADQIFGTRPIMDDVVEGVTTARYIIADLTGNNPNVLYEVGFCHALGKDVIILTQDEDVPFDLRHIRYIKYEYTPRGMRDLEQGLRSTIESLSVLQ